MRRLLASLAIGVTGLLLLLAADRWVIAYSDREARSELVAQSEVLRSKLAGSITGRLAAVESTRAFLEDRPNTSAQEFTTMADSLLKANPSAFVLLFVDARGERKYAQPSWLADAAVRDPTKLLADFATADTTARYTTRPIVVSDPVRLPDGGLALLASQTVMGSGNASGIAIGAYNVARLVDDAVEPVVESTSGKLAFSLTDQAGYEFYTHGRLTALKAQSLVPVGNSFWRLAVSWETPPPTPGAGARLQLWAIGVLFLVLMIAGLNYFWIRGQALQEAVDERTAILRSTRKRLSSLLEQLPVGVQVYQLDGRWTIRNQAHLRNFQIVEEGTSRPGDILALGLLPGIDVKEAVDRAIDGQEVLLGDISIGREIGSASGRANSRIISALLFPIKGQDGTVQELALLSQDVTTSRRDEVALRVRARELEALRRIDLEILTAQSMEQSLRAGFEHLREVVDYDWVGLALIDLSERYIVLWLDESKGRHIIDPAIGFDAIRRFVRTDDGETITSDSADPDEIAYRLRSEGIDSHIRVGLTLSGALVGTFALGFRSELRLTSSQIEFVRLVAHHLSVAIEQSRLHDQIVRHAAELESAVAIRTAEISETNAQLESFAYTVSHDLRAPLRAIQGYGRILALDHRDELSDEAIHYLERITAASSRMDRLILDLLAYSRVGRTDMYIVPVQLSRVIDEAIGHVQTDVQERGADIHVDLPLPSVMAHRATLAQALANLIGNAVKFVGQDVRPEVKISAEARGAVVRIAVEDNGIGIPPDHADRVFRPFERLHSPDAYPGTGIGLAIVQKAIHRMGGSVGVEPREGCGSRFWVDLPLAEDRSAESPLQRAFRGEESRS